MTIEKHLEAHFDFKKPDGWTALQAKPEFDLNGFRTRRIAKLHKSNALQFTIGATKLGQTKGLNETIRAIIIGEGVKVVEDRSTAGNTKPKKEYPGFSLKKLPTAKLDRIVSQVFSAIKQVQKENNS